MGRSTDFYRKKSKNSSSIKKKRATDKAIGARPEQRKKRAEANKKRAAAKRNGQNVKGKDYDHKSDRMIDRKTNRGRIGEGGRTRKKNPNKGGPRTRK